MQSWNSKIPVYKQESGPGVSCADPPGRTEEREPTRVESRSQLMWLIDEFIEEKE